MYFNYLFIVVLNVILIQSGKFVNSEYDDIFLHLFGQMENMKKSQEIINTRLDILSERYLSILDKNPPQTRSVEKTGKSSNSIFDIRYDYLPKECAPAYLHSCAAACDCNQLSGIYNITDIQYSNNTITVYCDCKNFDGDWLYILRRIDGSENFERPWSDYVKGFGNIAGEFWLGLENLYALTNFYGPQELNVYLEKFDGKKAYARYDNFLVGNTYENYKLKSIGRYWGTAGDSLFRHSGMQFSTFDNDNDAGHNFNCAASRKGGFWYKDCTDTNPTGRYIRGSFSGHFEGSFWQTFAGTDYSLKTIIFMIRRKSAEILDIK